MDLDEEGGKLLLRIPENRTDLNGIGQELESDSPKGGHNGFDKQAVKHSITA